MQSPVLYSCNKFGSWCVTACLASLIVTFSFIGCTSPAKKEKPYRTVMMTTELVSDSAAIHFYDSLHAGKHIWPVVKEANLASGIREVHIWRYGNRLVMQLQLPADIAPAELDSLYLSVGPGIVEWGRMMSNLQRSLPGVDSSQKWVEMSTIHHYLDGQYLK